MTEPSKQAREAAESVKSDSRLADDLRRLMQRGTTREEPTTDDNKLEALGEALHGLSARLLITGALEDNTIQAAYEKVQVRFSALRHARIEALKQHAPDTLLLEACALYDDALDMMFDGPDESDEGYARARWNDARAKIRKYAALKGANP